MVPKSPRSSGNVRREGLAEYSYATKITNRLRSTAKHGSGTPIVRRQSLSVLNRPSEMGGGAKRRSLTFQRPLVTSRAIRRKSGSHRTPLIKRSRRSRSYEAGMSSILGRLNKKFERRQNGARVTTGSERVAGGVRDQLSLVSNKPNNSYSQEDNCSTVAYSDLFSDDSDLSVSVLSDSHGAETDVHSTSVLVFTYSAGAGEKCPATPNSMKQIDLQNATGRFRSLTLSGVGQKLLISDSPPATDQLQHTYNMIDHWQEEMNRILAENWKLKRLDWISQCHNVLWNILENLDFLEDPSSDMFPSTLLPVELLSDADWHWRNVLISSAQILFIEAPDFSDLTHDPQGKKADDEEFQFKMHFQFGYDIDDIARCIHLQLAKLSMKWSLCQLMAEFIGHSKFICYIEIYFKKTVSPWWEQDGIVKVKFMFEDFYVDIVNFSEGENVYFVDKWPQNSILLDQYTFTSNGKRLNDKDARAFMEKKFISAVCCQIVHLCICQTTPPQSCAARNVLKQISVVLKGWFIGVLLGEALKPLNVNFEYDKRAPSLAPRMTTTSLGIV